MPTRYNSRMNRPSIVTLCAIASLTIVPIGQVCAAEPSPAPEPAAYSFIRGITITCFRWGPGEWDAPIMKQTVEDVRAVGATWMTIHPYARIRNDGRVDYRSGAVAPAVTRPTQWALQRGLQVMIKPHLAYWGSRFPDRLAIDFGDDEAAWRRFFSSYERFIVHQAQLAEQAGARLFVVGTELDATVYREGAWRRIIEAVRAEFSGELTYAANHDGYGRVPFWDALDCVGVQAYWPVSTADHPTDEQLAEGWRRRLEKVTAYAAARDKMVLFTEMGYAPSSDAARRPWSSRRVERADGRSPDELKLAAMRIALREVERHPRIAGVFLWKWFPANRSIRSDFALQYPSMRRVIGQAWSGRPMPLAERWTMPRRDGANRG